MKNWMTNWWPKSKKIFVGTAVAAAVVTAVTVGDPEPEPAPAPAPAPVTAETKEDFLQKQPFVQAYDKKGNAYKALPAKNMDTAALKDREKYFIDEIRGGKIPLIQSELNMKTVQELYYESALKMGMTAADLMGGVNGFEFIRR